MQKLALWITEKPWHGVVVVLVAAVLPGFILAQTILGLITLRKGASAGLLIAAVLSASLIGIAHYYQGYVSVGVSLVTVTVIPIWLLSIVFRNTVSLGKTLLVAAGIVGIMCASAVMSGDWNTQTFYDLLCAFTQAKKGQVSENTKEAYFAAARAFEIAWPMWMFIYYTMVMLLARWWQARAFNPGGFRDEFQALHWGKKVSFPLFGILVMGAFWNTPHSTAIALLAGAVLSVHGLSVVHWYACTVRYKLPVFALDAQQRVIVNWHNTELKLWLLIPFYFLLLYFSSWMVLALVAISMVDSVYCFRDRYKQNLM